MATAAIDTNRRRAGLTRRGLVLLLRYWRMHPVTLTVAIFGAALYAACTVGSTIVLGRVTDSLLAPAFSRGSDRRTAALAAIAILAVAVARAGGIVVRRFFAGLSRARVARDLRSRVTDRYAALPLAYHRAQPTGDLLAHTQADIDAATDVIGPTPYSLAVVLMIVFATVLLVITDPVLAVIGCITLPGLAVLNSVFMHHIEGPAERAQRGLGEISAVAHESIDGALVVKTLGRQADEVERFAARADRVRLERTHMGRIRGSFDPALDAMPDLSIVALLAVGAWRVSTGAITTGTLVQFLALFQLLAFPMRLIGFLLSDFPRAVVGSERLDLVFSEPAPAVRDGAVALPRTPLRIDVEDVGFAYGDVPVLHGVSFGVAAGESVAVGGQTGAGKSTLVALLARLADPALGRIRIGGIDLTQLQSGSLRDSVAVVFQESFLFGTTVRDNIAVGRDVDDDAVVGAARIAQADGFIQRLPGGYNTKVGERGITLSGGQRQRIALARALVHRPRVLILDDATSAVDPTVEAAILDGLRQQGDITLLVVAYRVSTIRLADSVLLLDSGRIAAQGTHDQLLAHPTYLAMVRAYERREHS